MYGDSIEKYAVFVDIYFAEYKAKKKNDGCVESISIFQFDGDN
jgi:hypothetical protein